MEKVNFLSEQEHEFRPLNTILFMDEYNSEMPIFDDYVEPEDEDMNPFDSSDKEMI